MQVTIRPVASRRGLAEFIRFPLRLYSGDPLHVPHLTVERREFFSPEKNPLFEFTEAAYFLALGEGDEAVGRVSAHINRRHNEFWDERMGFFGFFECIEDAEVASALMKAAEAWLRERGMSAARGPMNFSTNEECGFLAEGFDLPPSFMMPYTKPCYLEFMEQLGYRPVKDLLAYDYNSGGVEPPYLERFSRRVSERMNVSVRPMQMHRFEEEVTRAFEVYNAAWARNWGFVPMTGGEFRYMARSLRHIIDPALALLAEVDGQPVGFSLGLPDFNLVLKKLGGRLWPFGFLRLLRAKRRIDRARVMVLGVVEKYRRKGVDALLYHTSFRNGLALGYWKCEMSWILEDNAMMNRALVRMGAWVSKRYRIFEKSL